MTSRQHINMNKITAWALAAFILFYALSPQTGLCLCEGCDCPNSLTPSKATPENGGDSFLVPGCCCKTQAVSDTEKEVSAQRCCQGPSDHSGSPCSCSCSTEKEKLLLVQSSGNSARDTVELLKNQFCDLGVPFSLSEFRFDLSPPDGTLVSPLSRLPLRLHLLLLVLLN